LLLHPPCLANVCQVTSNFADYFDKLSKRIAQLSNHCPRLSEYEKLFPSSPRLQQALSSFFAVVVVFCTEALKVVHESGKRYQSNIVSCLILNLVDSTGIKRFSKSIWSSFKGDFASIEESIIAAKAEVEEEIQLASEQTADGFRRFLTAEIEENKIARLQQEAEMKQSKDFRSQQTLALLQNKARQIQKIVKEEGNSMNSVIRFMR
jgi:hypothetical protein